MKFLILGIFLISFKAQAAPTKKYFVCDNDDRNGTNFMHVTNLIELTKDGTKVRFTVFNGDNGLAAPLVVIRTTAAAVAPLLGNDLVKMAGRTLTFERESVFFFQIGTDFQGKPYLNARVDSASGTTNLSRCRVRTL